MTRNNKHTLIFVIVALAIIIFLIVFNNKQTTNIKARYIDGKDIVYNDFTENFKSTKTIKITNPTGSIQVYSIRWFDIDNTVKEQNKFLYKISCDGDHCIDDSSSQVPNTDFDLFTDLYLEAFQHQTLTITFTYSGKKDQDAHFKGNLIVREGITDQKSIKSY